MRNRNNNVDDVAIIVRNVSIWKREFTFWNTKNGKVTYFFFDVKKSSFRLAFVFQSDKNICLVELF